MHATRMPRFEDIHLFPDERPGIGKAFDGALRDYF
jgi:hypothetical protein